MGPDHVGVKLVLGKLLLPDITRGGPITRPTEHLYPGHLLHLGGDDDGFADENDKVDTYDNINGDTGASAEDHNSEDPEDAKNADDDDDKEGDEDEDMFRL